MVKVYNEFKRRAIYIDEGKSESKCSECGGKGLIAIDLQLRKICGRCAGEGKLDWISRAMNQTNN